MTWPKTTLDVIHRLDVIRKDLADQFYLRSEAVDVLALGAVCHEHTLLLGPPGTAKTDLVSRFAALVDAPRFHYLLTRFTEPAELFGPMDLSRFQAGEYHVRTDGMLPRASIAFLDEVFQGGSAILNTLLTLVHERVFYNGAAREPVPLISLIGASNDLPEDAMLRAFSDRFVLRVHVAPVPDDGLKHLLDRGWDLELRRLTDERRAADGQKALALPLLKEQQIRDLYHQLPEVKLDALRPDLHEQILRELRAEGVELSDRRLVKGLKLVAGAALLAGRDEAAIADLWPLYHVWSRVADAAIFRSTIEPHLLAGGGAPFARARNGRSAGRSRDAREARQAAPRRGRGRRPPHDARPAAARGRARARRTTRPSATRSTPRSTGSWPSSRRRMCNPRRIEVTATRPGAVAWEHEVRRAASRSGTVTGEARSASRSTPRSARLSSRRSKARRWKRARHAGWTQVEGGIPPRRGGWLQCPLLARTTARWRSWPPPCTVVKGRGEALARLAGSVQGRLSRRERRGPLLRRRVRRPDTRRARGRTSEARGGHPRRRRAGARPDRGRHGRPRSTPPSGTLEAEADRRARADWEARAAERRAALEAEAAGRGRSCGRGPGAAGVPRRSWRWPFRSTRCSPPPGAGARSVDPVLGAGRLPRGSTSSCPTEVPPCSTSASGSCSTR